MFPAGRLIKITSIRSRSILINPTLFIRAIIMAAPHTTRVRIRFRSAQRRSQCARQRQQWPGLAPNNGEGFAKDLSGHELPNAPPFTVSDLRSITRFPLTADWAGTLHADYYWQDYSWARIFNDNPYDRLRGYTNVNLALILTNQDGWQVMGYLKNVFNTTAITGDFLNSDDSGLTTNVS